MGCCFSFPVEENPSLSKADNYETKMIIPNDLSEHILPIVQPDAGYSQIALNQISSSASYQPTFELPDNEFETSIASWKIQTFHK
jgi:hypothetical protein